MLKPTLTLALLSSSVALAVPTDIEFWYSLAGSQSVLEKQIGTFNASQKDYRILPKLVGNYREAEVRLIAALRAGNGPQLFGTENSFFPKLAGEGALANLESFENALDPALVKDFYPAVWNYGSFEGKRYGLPWNTSTPVLYYNATALAAKNLKPPKTWTEFEAVARQLSNRGSKGFIAVADSWQFEAMVASRGGSVVTLGGLPNFESREVVDALEMLSRMSQSGAAIPRSLGEAQFAVLDFVRTKAFMAVASIANARDIEGYSVAFKLGIAPMPCDKKCAVPLGGGQLVVLKSASKEQQAGSVAFWKYLMDPKNLEVWAQGTGYLSPRRAALPLLQDYYREDPQRKTAFEQLDESFARPKLEGYSTWRTYLEEAIEKVTKGRVPVKVALAEAQKKALSSQ